MMLSYMLGEDGSETIAVCLEAGDLIHLARGERIEVPLSDLQHAGVAGDDEVGHLARVGLLLLPPGSTDVLLHAAVEARDSGRDVRIRPMDAPGGEVTDGEA